MYSVVMMVRYDVFRCIIDISALDSGSHAAVDGSEWMGTQEQPFQDSPFLLPVRPDPDFRLRASLSPAFDLPPVWDEE